MARAGITYSEVEKAATRLHGENKNVSADNVRDLIGSGAKQRCSAALQARMNGYNPGNLPRLQRFI